MSTDNESKPRKPARKPPENPERLFLTDGEIASIVGLSHAEWVGVASAQRQSR